MNKKLIRLTESDLHRIVKESVQKILSEESVNEGENWNYIKQVGKNLGYNIRHPFRKNSDPRTQAYYAKTQAEADYSDYQQQNKPGMVNGAFKGVSPQDMENYRNSARERYNIAKMGGGADPSGYNNRYRELGKNVDKVKDMRHPY